MLLLGSSSPAPRRALFQVGQPDSHSRSSEPRARQLSSLLLNLKEFFVLQLRAENTGQRLSAGCLEVAGRIPQQEKKGFGPRSQGEASSSLLSVLRLERGSGHFH